MSVEDLEMDIAWLEREVEEQREVVEEAEAEALRERVRLNKLENRLHDLRQELMEREAH